MCGWSQIGGTVSWPGEEGLIGWNGGQRSDTWTPVCYGSFYILLLAYYSRIQHPHLLCSVVGYSHALLSERYLLTHSSSWQCSSTAVTLLNCRDAPAFLLTPRSSVLASNILDDVLARLCPFFSKRGLPERKNYPSLDTMTDGYPVPTFRFSHTSHAQSNHFPPLLPRKKTDYTLYTLQIKNTGVHYRTFLTGPTYTHSLPLVD